MKKTDDGAQAPAEKVAAAAPLAPIDTPAAEAAEEHPSEGGAYIRLPDGTLQREEEA